MTSKFTREELLNIIDTDHVQCGEASALARMVLSAMESEPVFTLQVSQADYKGQKLGNHFGFITLDAARELDDGNYQLYRHAQQPVVLDEAQSRQAFEKWCQVNIERNKWHPEFYAHLPAREQWDAWEACRAAMLAAAPQEVPDGK
ncbi:hypothetical protein [Klebsiella pneumoniae]|uniref:hypothetical protein n=1 Tax=Klebsiella pneumoniae TaxID=573 RepID=UPI0010830751|nr:hypothetical protein [Klebsiella pneumoniae]VGJ85716.1 Uncharacterised protein [Klebsiella pneumoniae]